MALRWSDAGESRILDFDCETLAAGFADPEWVPNRITAIAWSWIGTDDVHTRTILDYAPNLPTFLAMNFLRCKPMLEVVMFQAQGNQTRAAQLLGVNRNTLCKRLKQHGVD